jgi:hypothetical protein
MRVDTHRFWTLLRVGSVALTLCGGLMLAAGLGLTALHVIARPQDPAHLPTLFRVGLSLLALGMASVINGLTGAVLARHQGAAGTLTVILLLALPLAVPMTLLALGGVVAIWLAP